MKPHELKRALERLGLDKQADVAEWLDVDVRTVRRWLTGETPIPKIVALLLEKYKNRS